MNATDLGRVLSLLKGSVSKNPNPDFRWSNQRVIIFICEIHIFHIFGGAVGVMMCFMMGKIHRNLKLG